MHHIVFINRNAICSITVCGIEFGELLSKCMPLLLNLTTNHPIWHAMPGVIYSLKLRGGN